MTTRHERLYRAYATELRKAKTATEKWWRQLVASETAKEGAREAALARLEERWPLGPAAHPWVLAVLRKYWIACEQQNREIAALGDDAGDDEAESPIVFLCEYFLDGKNEKLAVFISPLNYWPIGTLGPEEGAAQ